MDNSIFEETIGQCSERNENEKEPMNNDEQSQVTQSESEFIKELDAQLDNILEFNKILSSKSNQLKIEMKKLKQMDKEIDQNRERIEAQNMELSKRLSQLEDIARNLIKESVVPQQQLKNILKEVSDIKKSYIFANRIYYERGLISNDGLMGSLDGLEGILAVLRIDE